MNLKPAHTLEIVKMLNLDSKKILKQSYTASGLKVVFIWKDGVQYELTLKPQYDGTT